MRTSRISVPVAALGAAHLAAGAVTNLLPGEVRAVLSLGLMTTLSMVVSAFSKRPPRQTVTAVAAATALSLSAVYAWRRLFDPRAVLGPVPPPLEAPALLALGGIGVVASAVVARAFSPRHRTFRVRWVVFGVTEAALVALCVTIATRAAEANSPGALLRRVVSLEQSSDETAWGERQELSTALAALGRQREARAVALSPDAVGRELSDPPGEPDAKPPFAVTPWRDGVAKIAAERRLVLIMEAHTVSEHRAWIDQTLPSFRAAGFTHYLAEAIAEPGAALASRGYPVSATGVYTRDPRFGNLVRTAVRLGFEVDGYDHAGGDFDRREEGQATVLAGRFASRPDSRMVVHAGHGHVFKHEVRNVGRYMAARLWKKTGVEPFTIWQLSNELPGDVYRRLIRQVGPIAKPVMLVPLPREVSEALFPESTAHPAVDAVVLHPPRLGKEPTDRHGAFSDQLVRVPGAWLGDQWPVVISAISEGEPDDAIALDQIMLRQGETEFELWLPTTACRICVWNLHGKLRVRANVKSTPVRVEVIR